MDITKSTLWGALALVVLAVAIFAYRSHLLANRNQCKERLQLIAYRLDQVMKPGDQLPTTMDGLKKIIKEVPTSTIDGRPFKIHPKPLRWRHGEAAPYLQDPAAHPKVNGVHMLGTDGKVRQPARPEDFAGTKPLD
ncbi:MAG: hypothetical protein ACYDCO_11490 [Armatimonadota bacterium]